MADENETNTPPEGENSEPASEPASENREGDEGQGVEPQSDIQGETPDDESQATQEDEAAALAAAMEAVSKVQGVADSANPVSQDDAEPFQSPEFVKRELDKQKEPIDLLSDVNMNVRIELGRTKMFVEDVLKLSDGAVVELDKLAGDPVDVFVNDRKVAKGEVLVLNDLFCVRISELVDISSTAV